MAVDVSKLSQLEQAHKEQFIRLVQGNALLLGLNDLANQGKVDKSVIDKYYHTLATAVQHWQTVQTTLEGYGIPKFHPVWFSKSGLADMVKAANDISGTAGLSGLDTDWYKWVLSALAPVLTLALVTDMLTDTAQEKAAMVTETANACKDAGLTPEQCSGILTAQIQSTQSEGFWGTFKWPIIGIGAIWVISETGILRPKAA